ncbi:MAG: hypothetical protein EOM90_04665 [Alphaproteobacteria bacterium]|nr:hypothetical protein [Alphaproteobacteria bacterium]
MNTSITKLEEKIVEVERLLNDYKTALRVLRSIENEDITITAPSIRKSRNVKRITVKDEVLNDIKEAATDVSTNDLIIKYSERSGKTRKGASNTIYPILSGLSKEGKIESYKNDPSMIGSFWKIKQ